MKNLETRIGFHQKYHVRFLDDTHKQRTDVGHESTNSKTVRAVKICPRLGSAKELVSNVFHLCPGIGPLIVIRKTDTVIAVLQGMLVVKPL